LKGWDQRVSKKIKPSNLGKIQAEALTSKKKLMGKRVEIGFLGFGEKKFPLVNFK